MTVSGEYSMRNFTVADIQSFKGKRQLTKTIPFSQEEAEAAETAEIETLNILNASLLAMKRAIKKLKVKPNLVLVDGNKSPDLNNYITKTIIKGDQKIKEISAASIVAKVSRDKLILKMSESFKKYKWDLNAGYGTKDHINAIRKYGITRFHRKTFNPIHNILSLKRKQQQVDSK